MPGVPREMKPMLVERAAAVSCATASRPRDGIYTRVLHTIGIGESEIDHRIDDLFRSSENPKIAVLAHDFRADVKIMAKAASRAAAEAMIAPLQTEIARRLDGHVFGLDEETPASAVHALLRERAGRPLAVAESCTGGRHRRRAHRGAGRVGDFSRRQSSPTATRSRSHSWASPRRRSRATAR